MWIINNTTNVTDMFTINVTDMFTTNVNTTIITKTLTKTQIPAKFVIVAFGVGFWESSYVFILNILVIY